MSTSGIMVTSKTVDLTNCDREQIQYAGAIQPHGALLVMEEPELRILQASRNTGELLGIPAQTLVGGNLRSLFSEEQLAGLRGHLLGQNLDGPPLHVARTEFSNQSFDVLAHRRDQVLILELERRRDTNLSLFNVYSRLSGAIAKLEAAASLQAFLDLAAQEIRLFSGFDRVMIYKFMEDKSGWVRSEALSEGLEPYLGLHYPSSDIPEPARRLFSLTWVRHQPDIGYTPVALVPENNPLTGGPLDLSYSLLRSVSIMYVDYLKNMGTRSSLVLTLLKEGKLWGLVACHHHTGPKHVPYEVRAACEFLAHMISLLMSAKEDTENYQYRMKLKSTQLMMVENISRRADFISGFIEDSPNLLDFVKAEGAATIVNGEIASIGHAPSKREIEEIVEWLSTAMSEQVFATDCLSAHLPQAVSFKGLCAGLMALRFSDTKDDFILWFRPEIIQTVNWAGDPKKPVDLSSDGQRLLPRTSFALWKETVRLKSSPWTEVELEAAKELRAALLELVLRRADELGRLYADLERSHAELDSFAYVASHDLKEPLRGIHNYAEMLSEEYADKLDQAGKEKLATLSRLSQRMSELLESLLEYSRLGRTEFSNTDVDLNLVASEAVDLLQSRIQADHVSIRIPRPLPVVKGDRLRLVEVFMNLISNAIKYNDKATKEIEIGFETSSSGGPPVLYVQDNGIGIEEKHYKQIFQIFRRLHAVNEYGGGSGAGLTIVRKIIDRIGGSIWLKSIVGQSTTFYFTLGRETSSGKHS
jgi:light-regulated signal transduction histidine kinase (bacteriophytochrome)